MTTYAQCSDCSEQIPASAPRCPVCLRERSREEIFGAISGHDPVKSAKRQSAFSALGWFILAAGVVSGGLYYQKSAAAKTAERSRLEAAAREAEKNRWQAQEEQTQSTLPPERSRVGVMSVSDTARAPRREDASPDGAARSGAGDDDDDDDFPVKEADTHWTVSGEVYDLVSLNPVRGLRLTFTPRGGGSAIRMKTDSRGRYHVRLPKSFKEYALTVRHKSYDGTYVEESGLSFRSQSKSRRLDQYRMFRQSPVLHVPLSPPHTEDAVEHSFVMLPN